MTTRRIFLAVVPLWVLAAAWVVIGLPDTEEFWQAPLRLALCAPLAFYLPGSMLADVMRIQGDTITRITLSVFLSIAVCIFAGIALHLAGRLDAQGWLYSLGGTTIVAWCLNLLLPPARPASTLPWAWPGPRFVIFLMSGILATGSVLMARPSAIERKPFAFTELWMVPQWDWTNNVVTVGVKNSEDADTLYSIDLVLGDTLIGQMPTFELAPSATRTFEFSVPTKTGAASRLEAWLYKDADRAVIYRKVWMTVGETRSGVLSLNSQTGR